MNTSENDRLNATNKYVQSKYLNSYTGNNERPS